jgi:hypothetical protein
MSCFRRANSRAGKKAASIEIEIELAKRLECVELAPAFTHNVWTESAGKPDRTPNASH